MVEPFEEIVSIPSTRLATSRISVLFSSMNYNY